MKTDFVSNSIAKLLYYLCSPFTGEKKDEHTDKKFFTQAIHRAAEFNSVYNIDFKDKVTVDIGSAYGGLVLHMLNHGAKYVHGIEIDKSLFDVSIENLKGSTQKENYEFICADARQMNMIESESIDIVVSNAVLEHIIGLDSLFAEIHRILKRGGMAYLTTGCTWFTWNAGHLRSYIPIPWCHLFLPKKIIMRTLELYLERGIRTKSVIENILDLYENLGKMSVTSLKRDIRKSNLQIVSIENHSDRKLKNLLVKLPILNEIFAGGIRIILRKKQTAG